MAADVAAESDPVIGIRHQTCTAEEVDRKHHKKFHASSAGRTMPRIPKY